MSINTELKPLFESIAKIASGMQKTILYWLLLGLLSAGVLAWQWLDFTGNTYWLMMQIIVLAIPLLLWGFFYMVISQLSELPELVQQTKSDGLALVADVKQAKSQPKGLFGRLWQLLKLLRHGDNLFVIIEAVQGVALIANPFFALLILFSGGLLLLFSLAALLTVVF